VLEQVVPEHLLIYIYQGTMNITTAEGSFRVNSGECVLLGRNQLGKFNKVPEDGNPYKAATVFLDRTILKGFYSGHPEIRKPMLQRTITFKRHPLLENLFRSVSVFSDLGEGVVPEELARLKMQEAVTLIRTLNIAADDLLSDFSEPHKVDLSDFMQKNFMFNIPISRFAYLTGRSLAAFKRDFRKNFNMPPQRWLTAQRLELAHFLIAERGMKASAAYVDAGFENFSHFTFAFKKHFGYNASAVMSRQTHKT
ncbi:MAG: AraC family transcriptional regulator, partial [Pedobacter sp.]|uniref:helix-turn-helix domain-containing protein n=1 Tax=Pedobacter sp. TaxID=1411316 RepID=UPI0033923BFE